MQKNISDYELSAELNLSGLLCPLPVLKCKQALSQLKPNEIIKVLCTDAGSVDDIPSYIRISGHKLLALQKDIDSFTFIIQKGQK